ncbi:MAG TPA: VOC family protein [Mesorhizobium sp.]|jgi:catechol 2,3-dioxygenase-like lactoylglutathione lyase family enzyme|uniref:VOC family protein n=1 Tax=Mesorhizobium sp. TaxID=1871066 RepID=UPI002DDDBC45|nr:VOC family protein [Mesorhizobium sp.]HEV2504041.1 VOC family protein [Mesorhizobium sp.]
MPSLAKMRVARPSDDLEALLRFYRDGLGLQVLARFDDHNGFDGILLGHPKAPYHLEFTKAHGEVAGRAPSKDHLLVFYLPEQAIWEDAVASMKSAGFDPVPSFNPYWDKVGVSFQDPDGYRVVLQRAEWSR